VVVAFRNGVRRGWCSNAAAGGDMAMLMLHHRCFSHWRWFAPQEHRAPKTSTSWFEYDGCCCCWCCDRRRVWYRHRLRSSQRPATRRIEGPRPRNTYRRSTGPPRPRFCERPKRWDGTRWLLPPPTKNSRPKVPGVGVAVVVAVVVVVVERRA